MAGACSQACPKGVDPAFAIQLLKRTLVLDSIGFGKKPSKIAKVMPLADVVKQIEEFAPPPRTVTKQRSGWQIRHDIRGHFSSAITITKSSAGQSRKSSKGYVISDRTKTDRQRRESCPSR
jgi:Fe-S oxidoreductase